MTTSTTLRTSEKAGAAIVRYLFHSSPSEATMLPPKTIKISYSSTGLGNWHENLSPPANNERSNTSSSRRSIPYFDSRCIRKVNDSSWGKQRDLIDHRPELASLRIWCAVKSPLQWHPVQQRRNLCETVIGSMMISCIGVHVPTSIHVLDYP
jgi:hypothetical protein